MTRKKALIIGISNYGKLQPHLPGCLQDATEWRDVLMDKLGFEHDWIRLLCDDRATKPEIISRLKWLLMDAKNDDHLVFVFAGHGTQIRRRDTETGDLADGLDEALVCYPSVADDFLLYDDELIKLTSESKGRITLILDCCHSGGMARGITYGAASNNKIPISRSLKLPVDLSHRLGNGKLKNRFGMGLAGQNQGIVTMTAAQEFESAFDDEMTDGQSHGVFSYYATRELKDNSTISFEDLLNRVSQKVSSGYSQHAMLFGLPKRIKENFFS
jgi:hypothetical protein